MQATAVHFDESMLNRLDTLADTLKCSREAIITQAVSEYLEYDAGYRAKVQKGLDAAERGEFVSHEEVKERIRRLGVHVD